MGIQIVLDPGVGDANAPELPEGPAPVDERSPGFRDLERKVLAEYDRIATVYEDRRGKGGAGVLDSGLPDRSPVVVDRTLLAGLCLRYVTDGWAGIAAVQDTVMDPYRRPTEMGPEDIRFFQQTRALLRMLIARTLVDLEERAAQWVREGEKACSAEVQRTWELLGIKTPEEQRRVVGKGARSQPTTYAAEKTELLGRLHRALHAIAAVLRDVAEAQFAKEYIRGSRGWTPGTDLNFDRIAAGSATIAAELTKDPLFAEECPLGLLGVRLTDRLTTRDDLADRLGAVLDRMRASLARLRGSEVGGRAERVVGDPSTFKPDTDDRSGGPEVVLIDEAFRQMQKDRDGDKGTGIGWLPLVHQPTWERMVREGGLPEGGWGLAVAEQYLRVLRARRAADAAKAKEEALFWQRIDKVASGLSLLAFVAVPVGGLVLAAARGVLTVASVTLLVHQVTSAVEQASLADEKILSGVAVSGAEAVGADVLAEVGEAAWIRHTVYGDTLQSITVMMLAELIGARVELVRQAVDHYSYLEDIRTLMEPRHGAADTEGEGRDSEGQSTEGQGAEGQDR